MAETMNSFVVKRRPFGSSRKWRQLPNAPQTKKNAIALAEAHDRAFPRYEHVVFAWHTDKPVKR